MPIDHLYEREKKMDKDDATMEWFEAKINDVILEYCSLRNLPANPFYRSEAIDFIYSALKNV